ncbi:TonB-dependent receptor [Winogradskyella psychrotolerans]|uniref:SusC/RagA family TonB-linked outer membrane protein n=1 Tax=Winogradskyella psychrotolerans TaxID=1344585 RepID=UPI001C07C086|nr:TonB-dependent receptor [Winogradskyella psychrotolerans]MBU2922008.1 TonB-dependent receptor [Winogradskyella psychrotolerans]
MKTVLNALLFCLIMLPATLLAQSTATGTVTDKANAMPMPGVNVIIKGTSRGTVTDFDGNYSIELSDGEVLVFSYVGYTTQEIVFTGQTRIDVVIEEDASILDEVVLIGYGSVQKEDVTGAVDLIKAEDFNQGPVVSAQQLISGKIAGVSVTSGSGAPGEGQNILIRGNGSLSLSSNPLIVLDGIPLDNGGVGGSRNPLNLINPNDIENMTILKDASATSIYGSRGANGVIIITTKKGKDSEFKFNATTSTTVHTSVDRVNVLNANQFRDIVTNHPNADATTIGLLGNSNTNWQDEIYQTAFGQDHSFSALGSLYGVPMRASIGHSDHDGNLIGDNFQRTTASLNFSPKLFDDHLKLDISARGNYTENVFADRGAIGNANTFDPTQAVYDSSSQYGGYFSWIDSSTGQQPNLAGTNPVALLNLRDDTSEVRRYILNVKADYKFHFFPDLTATLSAGIDESNSHGRTIVSELIPTSNLTWNGSRSSYVNESSNKLFDAYLTYNKSLNDKHNITAVAGYSYQSFEYDNFSYDSEAEERAIADPSAGIDFEFIDKSKNVLLSYFGRLNYDYDGKYLVTATLRADASSVLNPEDRWGYFPSVALAWNINNEDFFNSKNINELKLRLGYGEVGNVNGLDPYLFLTRYTGSESSANYQFGNTFYQTYRPNPFNKDLRWEVGNTFNVGLDYSLFDRRISGSVNVYQKLTKDLIASASVDPFTNFGSEVKSNIGDMENRGIEFALNLVPIKTEDFEWSVNYNIAFNDNEITNLPFVQETGGVSAGTGNNVQLHAEGEAPYSFYVYQQVYDTSGNPIEGAFVDRNGDNVINDSDKYIYKDPYADIIMGLNTNLSYKKWDLAVVTRANIGNYAYNDVSAGNSYLNGVIPTSNNFLSNLHSSYLDNGFISQSNENTFRSSHYIEDASFFKIDNITLGYTLDNAIKNVTLRLYGSVQNVATITDYNGLDPEITGGIDSNFYPRPRSFVFGVNVDF